MCSEKIKGLYDTINGDDYEIVSRTYYLEETQETGVDEMMYFFSDDNGAKASS